MGWEGMTLKVCSEHTLQLCSKDNCVLSVLHSLCSHFPETTSVLSMKNSVIKKYQKHHFGIHTLNRPIPAYWPSKEIWIWEFSCVCVCVCVCVGGWKRDLHGWPFIDVYFNLYTTPGEGKTSRTMAFTWSWPLGEFFLQPASLF